MHLEEECGGGGGGVLSAMIQDIFWYQPSFLTLNFSKYSSSNLYAPCFLDLGFSVCFCPFVGILLEFYVTPTSNVGFFRFPRPIVVD